MRSEVVVVGVEAHVVDVLPHSFGEEFFVVLCEDRSWRV